MAGSAAIFGGEIADGDVAKGGSSFFGWGGRAKLFGKPGGGESVHIEIEDLADAVSLNVFVEDILDNSAAAHACFEANDFAATVVGATIIYAHITDAARGFAAEADEACGMADVTIADDNVFGGAID